MEKLIIQAENIETLKYLKERAKYAEERNGVMDFLTTNQNIHKIHNFYTHNPKVKIEINKTELTLTLSIRNPKNAGRKPKEDYAKVPFSHKISEELKRKWFEVTGNNINAFENALRDAIENLQPKKEAAIKLIEASKNHDFQEFEAVETSYKGVHGYIWLKTVNRKKIDHDKEIEDLAYNLTDFEAKYVLRFLN